MIPDIFKFINIILCHGCAVFRATNTRVGVDASDDASKIAWYHNADDDAPIIPPPAIPSDSEMPPQRPSLPIKDAFSILMQGGQQPTPIIGGTRRFTRTSKPSARLQAADNACNPLSSSSSMRKRALSSAKDLPAKRVATGIRASAHPDSEDDIEEMPSVPEVDGSSADEHTNPNDDDEDDNAEEAYLRTKALGDADRQARQTLRKADRTADLRTVYTEEKGRINTDTGIPEDGWWCIICRDAGLPARQSFFRGSVSTRRTHISRNPKCHFPIYKSRCEAQGIIMNERAIPMSVQMYSQLQQKTLDASLTPKVPHFTKAGLMDYIVELIVSEDEAIQLVDKGPFRRLLQYLRPSLSENDIPHADEVDYNISGRMSKKAVDELVAAGSNLEELAQLLVNEDEN